MRVCIITGGAKGIGKQLTRSFLNNGYKVCSADIDSTALQKLEKEIHSNSSHLKDHLLLSHTDISQEQQVKDMVSKTVERFHTVDVLVNNAAISNPYNDPIANLSLEIWNRYMATNLTGPFLCAKYTAPYLNKGFDPLKSTSAIINISSTRAQMSEPNSECYAAAKGGIEGLTHAMAMSMGPRIRVNAIAPGWIDTEEAEDDEEITEEDHGQHAVGRIGCVNDVAEMALFLADGNRSGFMTGQVMTLDGGMTRKMIYQE